MKAKDYLLQLRSLDTRINQKIRELDQLRQISSLSSINYSTERVQSTRSKEAPFVKVIHKIVVLEREINQQIDNFVDKKHLIINQIQELRDTRFINVLYKRYVEYKRYEDIAKEIGYSFDYVKELHKISLELFEKKHPTLSHF